MINYLNWERATYFINLNAGIDSFLVCRALICGIVSVSANPLEFYHISALVSGMISGFAYVFMLFLSRAIEVDDPMNVCQVHGGMSIYSLVSICFFHQNEGFFFKDIYTEYPIVAGIGDLKSLKLEEIAPIVLILGTYVMAAVGVIAISSTLTGFMIQGLLKKFWRPNYIGNEGCAAGEIIGDDVYWQLVLSDRILMNHLQSVINQYFVPNPKEYVAHEFKKEIQP